MDEIVKVIGLTNNCTFCGVFRRQALDRGAMLIKADKILTGHNADDIAETVYMNALRGDFFRLGKCVDLVTGTSDDIGLPRAKPYPPRRRPPTSWIIRAARWSATMLMNATQP